MGFWGRIVAGLMLFCLVFGLAHPLTLQAQATPPDATEAGVDETWLEEMLAQMSTADKVGQLFLVSFPGNEAGADSDIARLIQLYRVGAVVLSPEEGNVDNSAAAPELVLELTTALQELAFSASGPLEIITTIPVTPTGVVTATELLTITPPVEVGPPVTTTLPLTTESGSGAATMTVTEVVTTPAQAIPLLIGVVQEGGGYPYTNLRGGFSEVPSNMALGATWKPAQAEAVGRVVGQELAAVGVNLLLGPSLDVLRTPRPGQSGDLGTRVFGGDPFWVGEMGRAFISGVHLGSQHRVATVAKHLPGLGASDRSLEEEVATVDKSLQDLRFIELPAFFAVTSGNLLTDTTDAMMTAHIRYRGFQGNIRTVTPPISLHAQGMQQILEQPELVPWREAGGVLVSDSLGVPAVRRYYSPGEESFPHRQIALEAFQAGNDLLDLSSFSLNGSWEEQLQNVEDTIRFFQARYEAEESFRDRVDAAVGRILQLKRRVCPEFTLEASTAEPEGLTAVGRSRAAVAQTAQAAVSLLHPERDELALRLPRPPRPEEDILIFTDVREVRDCDFCSPFYILAPDAVRETILKLYGPGATGQVSSERVFSFSFQDLQEHLEQGDPDLEALIGEAEWILFAMLDYAPGRVPSSGALRDFLRRQVDVLAAKKIVVMAFEEPYYLDTTEISKLTAYLGVYDKSAPFVETAVRALFLEYVPMGRPPVTVEGIGYDLTRQLAPDPDQVISVVSAAQALPAGGTPEPIRLEVGDPLRVRTGVIVDLNGNPVPDGTPVTFHYRYLDQGLGGQVEATTVGGVAEVTITLEHAGTIELRATSPPARDPERNSWPLEVRMGDITQFVTPTPFPTATPTPTPTPTDTPTPTPTDTPTATPTPSPTAEIPPPPPPEPRVHWIDFVLALLGTTIAGGLVVTAGQGLRLWAAAGHWAGRALLWSIACGLLGYLFYGLGLPGSSFLEGVTPGLRGFFLGLGCGLLPLVAVLWLVSRKGEAR
jgi:beta-N-acetylhexosaminidase